MSALLYQIELQAESDDVGKIRTCKALPTCWIRPTVATACVIPYAPTSKLQIAAGLEPATQGSTAELRYQNWLRAVELNHA